MSRIEDNNIILASHPLAGLEMKLHNGQVLGYLMASRKCNIESGLKNVNVSCYYYYYYYYVFFFFVAKFSGKEDVEAVGSSRIQFITVTFCVPSTR